MMKSNPLSKDIFDLKNVPDILKGEIKLRSRYPLGETSEKIMEIFSIKRKLTINEVVIGVYRRFDMIMKRQKVSSTLSNLAKIGRLKALGKGVYEKV